MYFDYMEKFEKLGEDVPKIFERVAKRGAIKFVNTAKKKTDEENLVDTGNYKRNWFAEAEQYAKDGFAIICQNSVEYASHLEWGHKTRNGGRVKGKFVGYNSMGETEFYCLEQLEEELEKAYTKQYKK